MKKLYALLQGRCAFSSKSRATDPKVPPKGKLFLTKGAAAAVRVGPARWRIPTHQPATPAAGHALWKVQVHFDDRHKPHKVWSTIGAHPSDRGKSWSCCKAESVAATPKHPQRMDLQLSGQTFIQKEKLVKCPPYCRLSLAKSDRSGRF